MRCAHDKRLPAGKRAPSARYSDWQARKVPRQLAEVLRTAKWLYAVPPPNWRE